MINLATSDPLEILIEKEEVKKKETKCEHKIKRPCFVFIPAYFSENFMDPLDILMNNEPLAAPLH